MACLGNRCEVLGLGVERNECGLIITGFGSRLFSRQQSLDRSQKCLACCILSQSYIAMQVIKRARCFRCSGEIYGAADVDVYTANRRMAQCAEEIMANEDNGLSAKATECLGNDAHLAYQTALAL